MANITANITSTFISPGLPLGACWLLSTFPFWSVSWLPPLAGAFLLHNIRLLALAELSKVALEAQ